MAFQGFGKESGPAIPPRSQNPFGHFSSPPADDGSGHQAPHRPTEFTSKWDNGKAFFNDYNSRSHHNPSIYAPSVASRNYEIAVPATRSPSSTSVVEDLSRVSRRNDNGSSSVQRRTPSPPLARGSNHFVSNLPNPTGAERFPISYDDLLTSQEPPSVLPYRGSEAGKGLPTKFADVQVPKRTKSPPLSSVSEFYQENSHLAQKDTKRFPVRAHQAGIPVPKRTRSPPLPSSAEQVFQGNSHSVHDEVERENQAKAKRLARFKVELSQAVQSTHDSASQKIPSNRHDQAIEPSGDISNETVISDYEGMESSNIITGSCPDMCPESERAERERKGDLDQYERLEGDRNQTSKSLAIKKYNRTAEREADLIRPMPVLQKTMDYLLKLLDHPYDDRFLGMYNFLWDRMRAIRMDLRMQHIFNLEAITMLEQMIRLHIIAMHELCEYTKGEGLSEGFDAHLNIEQMNKTSVELFQMYDDHRKKGINVPTEREFRGYYALLKLDKHPGYKVEPAELSLDLAKMTSEIRQTEEVRFARDVARACRIGNFILFFRLARKASYLQACLMHAHFAKLRTQALASLHAGLQSSQGLPASHVAEWLGMEDEDTESLLEYHGFTVKEFEEQYIVKEGPFCNSDSDYPTKASKLVHMKKSGSIIDDVSSTSQAITLPSEDANELHLAKVHKKHEIPAIRSVDKVTDEEMPDFQSVSPPKEGSRTSFTGLINKDNPQVAKVNFPPWDFSVVDRPPEPLPAEIGNVRKPIYESSFKNLSSDKKAVPLETESRREQQVRPVIFQFDYPVQNVTPQSEVAKDVGGVEPSDFHQEVDSEEVVSSYHEKEAAEAKLKLTFRIWRRRAMKKRDLREQRQLAANAALNSISLGPPILYNMHQPITVGKFNINDFARERFEKQERSWSTLNVAEVIVGTLIERNPDANCICWKLIVCSQIDNLEQNKLKQSGQVGISTAHWLLSKIMPIKRNISDVLSSPGVSIWKKWVPIWSHNDQICCLSVVKEIKFEYRNQIELGASAVLFLVSESLQWELQKTNLYNLVMSLPSGSSLPLLILCYSHREQFSDPSSIIIKELGLHQVDKSRISCFRILFLAGNLQSDQFDGFFSDEGLREGLKWLAGESQPQPILHSMKTRELVLAKLNSLLEVLDKRGSYSVGPDQCISAFNEALNRSIEDVKDAANENRTCWPCPETSLFDQSTIEHRAVKCCLPCIGWSLSERIEPLILALNNCTLPSFMEDISWLRTGSEIQKDIENQRLQLENCLIRYLTQSSKVMGLNLARNEVSIMLQSSCRLELHDSKYYIIPNWVSIFRRIFNWRLMCLSERNPSEVYVSSRTIRSLHKFGIGDGEFSRLFLKGPSLDEMVEVGCNPLSSQSQTEAFQPLPETVPSRSKLQETTNASCSEGGGIEVYNNVNFNDGSNNNSGGLVVSNDVNKEADKLTKLLEQCNILQNMIDRKLSIYF